MNKENFIVILECALLSFDNVPEEKMIKEYRLPPELVKIGIRLWSYLKSKN